MTDTQKILVIDDDPDMVHFVSFVANNLGLNDVSTAQPNEFPGVFDPKTSLIFLDVMMPEIDGIQILRLLSERQCKSSIVLMSAITNRLMESTCALARALGLSVVGCLQKPFRLSAIESLLKEFAQPPKLKVNKCSVPILITEEELRIAIDSDQFVLHYQPQIDLVTNQVAGIEALVRWQRPGAGLVFPESFLPCLESLELINSLGSIVARHAIPALSEFQTLHGQSCTVSINVSASSLLDLELPDALSGLANMFCVEPEAIIIEVTETALLQNLSKSLDVLIRLRVKGFQISIDDFGTGYAMMEQLRYIPATELKIDRSFVQNMGASSSDRVVVEKTVEIGHELGMKVVAEGVETEAQLKFLQSIRCDLGQGYLFSRPLPSSQLNEWIERHRADPYRTLATNQMA